MIIWNSYFFFFFLHKYQYSGPKCSVFTPEIVLWDVGTWLRLVCLRLHKTKIQNLRVWSKTRFIDQEGTHWEDGRLRNTSNPSCSLDWIRGSKHQQGHGRGVVKVNFQGSQFPDKILTCRLESSLGWSHAFVGGPGSLSFLQSKPVNHCFTISPSPPLTYLYEEEQRDECEDVIYGFPKIIMCQLVGSRTCCKLTQSMVRILSMGSGSNRTNRLKKRRFS